MIADQDRNSSMVDVGDDPFAALRAIFNAIPLHNDSAIKPLTIEHFVRRKGSTTIAKNDIVLATHLSTEKFQNLVAQLKHWNGPASVAVFIRSAEDIDLLYKATEENQKNFRETSFHLVLERSFELPYPGNILRQVALGGVESHYFLALDVDHVPMPHDCHNKLLASVLPKISNASKHDTLFVVPAFSASEKLPLSKQDVLKLEKERKIDQLEKLSSPESHGPTKYQTWLESTETSGATYSISITSDQSMEYHPYVLGFKPGIPRYREGKIHNSNSNSVSGCLFNGSLISSFLLALSQTSGAMDQTGMASFEIAILQGTNMLFSMIFIASECSDFYFKSRTTI